MRHTRFLKQKDPPYPPQEVLPSMYDLLSENPEETGLPDEYHWLQSQLLSATFRPPAYPAEQIFNSGNLNLYYDVRHPDRYKCPDWFAVMGVPRLYEQQHLRLNYVVWQEGINPFVVVEILSPETEIEDLGRLDRTVADPPTKWDVYEQILRVPYYIVFNRYSSVLLGFGLEQAHYQQLETPNQQVWMIELGLGLGIWQGVYQGIERQWLRWFDADNNWLLTDAEREWQRAEQERQRVDQLTTQLTQLQYQRDIFSDRLRVLGVNPDELLS